MKKVNSDGLKKAVRIYWVAFIVSLAWAVQIAIYYKTYAVSIVLVALALVALNGIRNANRILKEDAAKKEPHYGEPKKR